MARIARRSPASAPVPAPFADRSGRRTFSDPFLISRERRYRPTRGIYTAASLANRPIVIDNGSHYCRAGFAVSGPRLSLAERASS